MSISRSAAFLATPPNSSYYIRQFLRVSRVDCCDRQWLEQQIIESDYLRRSRGWHDTAKDTRVGHCTLLVSAPVRVVGCAATGQADVRDETGGRRLVRFTVSFRPHRNSGRIRNFVAESLQCSPARNLDTSPLSKCNIYCLDSRANRNTDASAIWRAAVRHLLRGAAGRHCLLSLGVWAHKQKLLNLWIFRQLFAPPVRHIPQNMGYFFVTRLLMKNMIL